MVGDWKKLKLGTNDYWVYDGPSSGYSLITLDTGIVCNTSGIVMHNSVELQYYMAQRIAGMHEMAGLSIAEQLYKFNESRLSLKNDESVEVGSITSMRYGETGVSEYYCTMSHMHSDNNYVDVSDSSYPAYRANAVYYVKFKILGPSDLLNGLDISWKIRLQKGNTTRDVQINAVVTYVHEAVWVDGNETAYVDSLSGGQIYYNNTDTGINVSFTWTGQYFLSFISTNNKDHLGISVFYPSIIDNQPKYGMLRTGANDNIDISDVSDDPTPIEEDGFVNNLENQFSPRARSSILGLYTIEGYVGSINSWADFAFALMNTDFESLLAKSIFGSDGKEYLISINHFHGLNPHLTANNRYKGPSDVRVGNRYLHEGDIYVNLHNLDNEYCVWETPSLHIDPHFTDYRDYLTRYQLFLPYYGFVDVDPNDAVDADIKIYYNINLVTRAAVIQVTSKSFRTDNKETKILSVTTTVGEEIPFCANGFNSMGVAFAQVAGKAISVGTSIATGNAGIGIAASSTTRAVEKGAEKAAEKVVEEGAKQAVKSNLGDAVRSTLNQADKVMNAVNNLPVPQTNRSNGSGSEPGTMDELFPYFLISRPVTVEPSSWASYVGLPTSKSLTLSSCSGFTQIAAVMPDTLTNAPKYLPEIISLLQAGVYL